MERLGRITLSIAFGMLLTLAVGKIASQATPRSTLESMNTGQHFLPPYGNVRDRFGFDSGSLSGYDVPRLHAGWYSDWGANLNPAHPDQLVYAQLVVLRAGADPHDPSQVTTNPSKAMIAQIAAAHPGSLWLVGNEPDSIYQGAPILPEVYAVVYHDVYEHIVGLDPTALIANGGIVQPTPCRLEYLDIVWDTYLATYGEPMPVDAWNIHAFVLREVYGSWGASTPPGVDPSCGIDYAVDDADDVAIFWDNIRAMRVWMRDKGQQDRPLIITEYGILWPEWFAPQFTPARVSHFMTRTFDLFLYTTDSDIGYPADDSRLVQAWAWYSLSEDQLYNGYLFYSGSKTLSPMGEAYEAYTAALSDTLYSDLSARLLAASPSFTRTAASSGSAGLMTFTVSLTGSIGNLGKLPAANTLTRLELVLDKSGTADFGRDALYTVPARFEGVVVLSPMTATLGGPGRYELHLTLDPEDQFVEPREWNNVATTTLDLRPDLTPIDLSYRLTEPVVQTGTLVITATAHNRGSWSSPAVSATVSLHTVPEGTLGVPKVVSVPALEVGDQVRVGVNLTWAPPDQDLYYLALELDKDDAVAEQNEDNNRLEKAVPLVLRTTLSPTTTTVLTSASGAIRLVFPAGTVATPTEILYRPLWLPGGEISGLKTSNLAFSLTAVLDDQLVPLDFAKPVSVTWRYRDVDVSHLEEEGLRLFVSDDWQTWRDAACQPYRRDQDQNWLEAAVCRTGLFVFGNRHDLYTPLILRGALSKAVHEELLPSVAESDWHRSPLRLP